MKKNYIIYIALAALSVAVSACNTVEGAGRDVSSVGHATTETARDVKHDINDK